MASIGDLWLKIQADAKGFEADVVKKSEKAGDAAGQSLGKRMAAGLKKFGPGAAIGAGAFLAAGAMGVLSGAASKLGDILGDATAAALAEDVSIQKLGTALKANIPNWDGNTAAIERVLASRMKLGFSDDEQRESLALLVVATNDVSKALDIQRVAMDLARLKRITLAEASEALVKVEGGGYKLLKSLGIQLKDNATQTDALVAVQKAAEGQAEDYAETNEGKLLVSQIKVGEAMEKLGARTMPIVVEATVLAAEAVDALGVALEALSGTVPETEEQARSYASTAVTLADALARLHPAFASLADFAHDNLDKVDAALDHSTETAEKMRGGFTTQLVEAKQPVGELSEAAKELLKDFRYTAKQASESFEDMRDRLVDAAGDLIDKAFDPIIEGQELAADQAELTGLRRERAAMKAGSVEAREADAAITRLEKRVLEHQVSLLQAGALSTKAQAKLVTDLKTQIGKATGPAKTYLQGVLDLILKIEKVGKIVPINIRYSSTGQPLTEHRAAGGPVSANVPYIVGERRAELFVPSMRGTIYPSVQSGAAAIGAGGDTYQIGVTMPVQDAPDPFETASQLRRLADFKMLTIPKR